MKTASLIILVLISARVNSQGLIYAMEFSDLETEVVCQKNIKSIKIDSHVKVIPSYGNEFEGIQSTHLKYYDTLGRLVKFGTILYMDETTSYKDTFWVEYKYYTDKKIKIFHWLYKPSSQIEMFYNSEGKLIKSTLLNDRTNLYQYAYNDKNQLTGMTAVSNESILCCHGNEFDTIIIETYEYNEDGTISKFISEVNKPLVFQKQYDFFYDSAGLIIERIEIYFNKKWQTTSVTVSKFEYNENGLLTHELKTYDDARTENIFYIYEFYQ